MIIPFNLLMQQITSGRYSNSGWLQNYSGIESKDVSVIMLCILFHNDKISRKSFTQRMHTYFEGGLLDRRLGVYKSKILNEWYNDTLITDVLVDEVIESCSARDLTINEYLKYLNLGFNRNQNFCVDYIAFSIFKPIISHYNRSWVYDFLRGCGVKDLELTYLTFDEADRQHDLSAGYCCEDCDGCLYQYKLSRYECRYKNDNESELSEKVKNVLLTYKTHLKNPTDKLFLWF